jgi:hypothetical protein
VALLPNNLAAGQTVTLSYEARWLHGLPEPLLRLNGNWLEATAILPVPNNLGSPGMPNSTYITNAGPAIYNVTHNPPLPAAGQPVVVTANVNDPDGVQNLTLYYRLDPATNYTAVPMLDNGTGGDAVPDDGVSARPFRDRRPIKSWRFTFRPRTIWVRRRVFRRSAPMTMNRCASVW